jgi:hypothetical protein
MRPLTPWRLTAAALDNLSADGDTGEQQLAEPADIDVDSDL